MPPKNKGPSQSQPQGAEIKDDNVIQTVLLADPFDAEQSWGPLIRYEDDGQHNTRSLPWCLIPLLGTPLLIWTLESLALGGVQHVYLFIAHGIDQVQEFLRTTRYMDPNSKLTVTLHATTAYTPGDVLREVDSRALLKTKTGDGSDVGTFILAKCGYIGNLDLSLASERFAARRKAEGGLPCLTTLVKSAPASSHATQTIHLLTPNSRLTHVHVQNKFPPSKRYTLPAELFEQPQDCLLRSDLQTIGLEICSIEVPQLFTENFDYQQVKPDFIHGIITSDLLGKTILCEVVNESENLGSGTKWATLVESVKTYDSASRDVLARRSQPFTLDVARPSGLPLTQRRGMVYVGKDIDLAPGCKISSLSCIDSYSTIGAGSKILHSYIGENVQIGPGVQIIDSYIFDKVSIGANTIIRSSIVGSGARILSDCVLAGGCLIGAGVVIGEKVKLMSKNVGLEGIEGSEEFNKGGSIGSLWLTDVRRKSYSSGSEGECSDSEDVTKHVDPRNYRYARMGTKLNNCDLDWPETSSISSFSSSSSVTSYSSDQTGGRIENIESIGAVSSTNDFLSECNDSLDRAFTESHTVENASIELITLRMASNVTQSKLRTVVINKLCVRVAEKPTLLQKWAPLVKYFLSGEDDIGGMEEVLFDLQRWTADDEERYSNKNIDLNKIQFFSKMVQHFYNEDVIDEEGLKKWLANVESKKVGGIDGLKLRAVGVKILQMILEDDDDDDGDEESD